MIRLQFTAGRGPVECRLALAGLLRALLGEARGAGVEAEVVETEEAEHGPLSAVVALRGEGAEEMARSWIGTVLWSCPSPVRRGWPRRNWFVGVAALAPPAPRREGFSERDLRWETFRSSGAGGQHVNKTDSAVRLRHLPSGVVVECRSERSQHRNRALALARLSDALAERAEAARRAADRDRWARHDSAVERGGEAAVRVYEGPDFRRRR